MGKIRKIIGALIHAPARFDLLAERIEEIHRTVMTEKASLESIGPFVRKLQDSHVLEYDRLETRTAEMDAAEEDFVRRLARRMASDEESMRDLNRGAHSVPAVMGDQSRLHIKTTSEKVPCYYQLTSGSVTIGEYFSAGPNVSLIAEKVNLDLRGLHRIDHIPADGCDIVIGDGVYIGAGSILLGPCTVGDNAVILPGSVVLPGTEIPGNSIWSGNPAVMERKPGKKPYEDDHQQVLLRLMEENGGLLFLDGWSREIQGWWQAPGRRLVRSQGKILTDKKSWQLEYYLENGDTADLKIAGPLGETVIGLNESEGTVSVDLPITDGEAREVSFIFPEENGLTIALSPSEKRRSMP